MSYFQGNDSSRWRRGLQTYRQVRARGVYPGIDLLYHSSGDGRLEYDFVVAPGADPGRIKLRFHGADGVALDEDGNLALTVGEGRLVQEAPVLYQEGPNGERSPVDGAYRLGPGGAVTFRVGAYDRGRPLVIDPVLAYSTFLGGAGGDEATSVAVGPDGSIYLCGFTQSYDFNPAQGPSADPVGNTGGNSYMEAFVTRLSPDGSTVLYFTYLGGNYMDWSSGIAVDAQGCAYVGGSTHSIDFPATHRTINDPAVATNAAPNAWGVKLSANGSTMLYGHLLGGEGPDFVNGIAVDAQGAAYLVGHTMSQTLPVTPGAFDPSWEQPGYMPGHMDAWAAKLTPTGSTIAYCTYLGGNDDDQAWAVAVDIQGCAYITGFTESFYHVVTYPPLAHYTQFPYPTTAGAFRESISGSVDAFVTKLNPSGTALVYSTHLGGSNAGGTNSAEVGYGIAVDAQGCAYVVGESDCGGTFPVSTGAYRTAPAGSKDAFVTKLNAAGSATVYSTLLGGSDADTANTISLDTQGTAYVAGATASADFPAVNAVRTVYGGTQDAFAAQISPDGSALPWSTYLGGAGLDEANGIAVDTARGSIYVVGDTWSTGFPLANPFDATYGGNAASANNGGWFASGDAFVARFVPRGLRGYYFDDFMGTSGQVNWYTPVMERVDPVIDFNWVPTPPHPAVGMERYSVRWTGSVRVPVTGTVSAGTNVPITFYTRSDDGVRLWINGQLVIDNWTQHGWTENSATLMLVAGSFNDLKMEYFQGPLSDAAIRLEWASPALGIARQVLPSSALLPLTAAQAQNSITDGGNGGGGGGGGGTVPAAPSNLTATATSPSQINLAWTDNSNNETGFKIERKTGAGGTWSEIAQVGQNITAYSNTGLSPSTTYVYRVRAYNSYGNSAYSNEASATTLSAAGNIPPSVTLISPQNGDTFISPDPVPLSAIGTDPDGAVVRIEFFADNTGDAAGPFSLGIDTSPPNPFTRTWINAPAGTYTLTARATDNAGATGTSAPVTITVEAEEEENLPPTVTLTAPTNGATYTAPASISLSATATDSDGTVTQVQFFADNTGDAAGPVSLGTDASAPSPFTFSWANVPAGTYSLTAVATDDQGATATSALVMIVVDDGSAEPPAPYLASLLLSRPGVYGGGSLTATVTISEALAEDVVVKLRTSDAAVQIPANVVVPAGQTNVSFTVTTSPVSETDWITITAWHNGWLQGARLTVLSADTALAVQDLNASAGNRLVALKWLGLPEGSYRGFHVYRRTLGGPTMRLSTTPQEANVYADTGLTPGQTYEYSVSVVDLAGQEANLSQWVVATPNDMSGVLIWENPLPVSVIISHTLTPRASLSAGFVGDNTYLIVDGKNFGPVAVDGTARLQTVSAVLDTRRLSNGLHTIQIVGFNETEETYATLPLQIQTMNNVSKLHHEEIFVQGAVEDGDATLYEATLSEGTETWTFALRDAHTGVVIKSLTGKGAQVRIAWRFIENQSISPHAAASVSTSRPSNQSNLARALVDTVIDGTEVEEVPEEIIQDLMNWRPLPVPEPPTDPRPRPDPWLPPVDFTRATRRFRKGATGIALIDLHSIKGLIDRGYDTDHELPAIGSDEDPDIMLRNAVREAFDRMEVRDSRFKAEVLVARPGGIVGMLPFLNKHLRKALANTCTVFYANAHGNTFRREYAPYEVKTPPYFRWGGLIFWGTRPAASPIKGDPANGVNAPIGSVEWRHHMVLNEIIPWHHIYNFAWIDSCNSVGYKGGVFHYEPDGRKEEQDSPDEVGNALWDFRLAFNIEADIEYPNAFIGWSGKVSTNALNDGTPSAMFKWRKEFWKQLGLGTDVDGARVSAYTWSGIDFGDSELRARERPWGNTIVPLFP